MEDVKELIRKSNIVYFNGQTVRDRYGKPKFTAFNLISDDIESKVRIDFWDEQNQILSLKSNY